MLGRRLYSDVPPLARTPLEDHPTLLVTYWCSIFALVIIFFRLAGRYVRTEQLFHEDKVMALSILPLMARLALVHVILIYGTNNAITTGLGPGQIHKREIGSGLVLLSRIMYAAFLWIEKFTITEFLARLTRQYWKKSFETGLRITKWTLLATFILVIIGTIAECQPFPHYWQVVPDPGPRCRQGYVQLLTMGVCNVATDLLLVFFPIPIVLTAHMPVKRKARLTLLFALSLIPAGITLYRIPSIIERKGVQQYRTLWASIEILAAAAVANALVLGSFVRDRGPKKAKYRFGSTNTESSEWPSPRRGTAATAIWGSDEDLVRDMGLGIDPEFRAMDAAYTARPAPMAFPHSSKPIDPSSPDWPFPASNGGESDIGPKDSLSRNPEMSAATPRRVSFFDAGGPLDNHDRRKDSSSTTANIEPHHNPSSPITAASALFPQDVSGPDNSKSSNNRKYPKRRSQPEIFSQPRNTYPTPDWSHYSVVPSLTLARPSTVQSLQDVGGLLRG
ncbi:MAG: hypothetical protein M1840_007939 [Geoglossum simile]|nr:MAG: hypothetical protein M1840_007939 [Geoglossum simile]